MKTIANISRYKISKCILTFFCFFIGIGAVVGSYGMHIDTSGASMGTDSLLPYFQVLPFADVLFRDYFFSGIALFIVNGITNLTAGVLLLFNRKAGTVLGTVFGITLMLWISIQFCIFPTNILSILYFVFGLIQTVVGYIAFVSYKQEHFPFSESNYHNVGTNPDQLVVYFSRMGYTKKIAYEIADASGASLLEIKTTERIDGTAGFWWCGRFSLHRMGMPITSENVDLSSYRHITVCTPVWCFGVSSPIRTFFKKHKDKLKDFTLVSVHFVLAPLVMVRRDAENILGHPINDYDDVSVHFGDTISVRHCK